jgi:ubiquitin carboxyl-terminal hydrolase L3
MTSTSIEIFKWPPLESDPSIMTEYLHSVGLSSDWEIGECYGLDDDCLNFIPPSCVAMIVNAERLCKEQEKRKGDTNILMPYYMKQSSKLDNACGIIACLHSIFNNRDLVDIKENSILSKFWDQVMDKTPQERCSTLETFTDFQTIHRTYAMMGQSNRASSQDDVKCHYTAFVLTSDKKLIELDGTKQGPLLVAENIESLVHGTAQELMKRLGEGQISESLSVMTLVKV